MDDQNNYENNFGNDLTSVPAYQVLDDLEAASALDARRNPHKTMTPFDDVPQMEQMPPYEQQGATMGYAEPQQFQYAGPQQMPQQMQSYGYQAPQMQYMPNNATKFCKFCAATIPADAVICTACGRQVEALSQGPIIINNNSNNGNVVGGSMMTAPINVPVNVSDNNMMMIAGARPKSKWVSFLLCLFLGVIGVHKFYEGKIGWGIVYMFTGGLCGVGWLIDLIMIALKPDPYYV